MSLSIKAQSPNFYNGKSSNSSNSKGNWTVQLNQNINRSGSSGCETDGTNFYVTKYNSSLIWKISMTGVVLDSFTIAGVTNLKDLAYDGTYFYGGSSGNIIYQMDFNIKYKIATISSPNVTVKSISYDPNNDAFWVGDVGTDLSLVSRSGVVLNTIPAATHGLLTTYGTAFDTISAGGPYLWALSSSSSSSTTLAQLNVATGTQTGLSHDVTTDIALNGGFGGGLWIQSNLFGNTTTIGGMIRGKNIFGYDISTTAADLYDMELTSIFVPTLTPINVNTNITGSIINQGLQTINSYDISYSVDNGTPITQSITGVSISSFQTVNFIHSTPYVGLAGMHTIKVWVSNLNANVDQNNSNDTLITQTTGYNGTSAVQRMPLYETFTSSTCGPCVSGNTNMDALFAANPNKWVCVKYQMSWPGSGDPYFTSEGGFRRQYYSVVGVPMQEIDGGFNSNSNSVTQGDVDNAYSVPSFMIITADMILSGQKVTVNYNIDPKIDYPASARLYIAIVEQETHNNVGSNGETVFHWVMKKMLPYVTGTPIGPLTAGTTVSNSIDYTFVGNYRLPNSASDPINHTIEHSVEDFNNLLAVVWVQNQATKEVYQAALSSFTNGMNGDERDAIIKSVYPNPANDQLNIDLNITEEESIHVSVVNTLGKTLISRNYSTTIGLNNLKLDFNNISEGLYFVKIIVGDKAYMKPIIIKH